MTKALLIEVRDYLDGLCFPAAAFGGSGPDDQRRELIARLNAALAPKPAKAQAPALNAVGKPFSPSYDPNYRIKHKVSTAHLFKPYGDSVRDHLTSWDAGVRS